MDDRHAELLDLLEALCENRQSPEQMARLEQIVLNDPEAQQLYLNYIDLHGSLHWYTAVSDEDSEVSLEEVLSEIHREPSSVAKPQQDTAPVQFAITESVETSVASSARQRRQQKTRQNRFRGTTAVVAGLILSAVAVHLYVTNLQDSVTTSNNQVANQSASRSGIPGVPEDQAGSQTIESSDDTPTMEKPEGPKNGSGTGESLAADSRNIAMVTPDLPERATAPELREGTSVSSDLMEFIDQRIQDQWADYQVEPSPIAEDGEWIRRVYLDIVGHIPPAVVTEEFLADDNPEKRRLLIDRLLDHPEYVSNWTTIWSNLLVGRATPPDVDRPALEQYLSESFKNNRPWDEMVRDFIGAKGPSNKNGASNFLLAHLNNQAVPATAITAKIFMGVRVHCTQCHNHPFDKETTQEQFWTLNSFFKQTQKVRRFKTDPATGNKVFSHVELVNAKVGGPTFYEARNQTMDVAFPSFEGTTIDPGPHVDRRAELAGLMTSGDNPQFARAIVNRMWGYFFGFGFTPSIDDMGPHADVTHPEVLDRLSREFVESGCDLKQLIRWICNSQPYQLTSRFNDSNRLDDPAIGNPQLFSRMYVKSMTAEQVYDSLLVATGSQRAVRNQRRATESNRRNWLQQFVIAFETDENDEATSFEGTILQALMMMNGNLTQRVLSNSSGTLFEQVTNLSGSDSQKIRRLCLSALSRYPTNRELMSIRRLVRQHIAARPREQSVEEARTEALQDVFWAYLNSNAFVLNH